MGRPRVVEQLRVVCATCGRVVFRYASKYSGSYCSAACYTVAKRNRIVHGDTRRGQRCREYRIWANMKSRCYNPRVPTYARYGARGITICDEWRSSYEAFLRDMGRCPPGHSIDRINNDGNYEPSNCRWVPLQIQSNNKRGNRVVEYQGERYTVADLARIVGIPRSRLVERLDLGWTIENAVSTDKFLNGWDRQGRHDSRSSVK